MRAVVAEPDEKARAKRACSRAATAFSKLSLQYICQAKIFSGHRCAADLFGFELLVYSYAPTGFPTPVWANVVDSEIYS